MQQAITTTWIAPSNTLGSRVKAFGKDKRQSITDAWDHGSSIEENHARVAKLLAAKLEWFGLYVAGHSGTGDGYVYVHVVSDGRPYNDAEGLAYDWRRNNTKTYGVEGRDWFYLPISAERR